MSLNQDSHQSFLTIAKELSTQSKCQFTQVACLLVDNSSKRIKATGVNGTPPGMRNCCNEYFEQRDDHLSWSNDHEIHAEMNMILDLAESGSGVPESYTIYVTLSPCMNCLKHLIGLKRRNKSTPGLTEIVYADVYHRYSESQIKKLEIYAAQSGVAFTHVKLQNKIYPH